MEKRLIKNRVSQAITNCISTKTAQRIYSIDTFRVISIFFVIFHHIGAFKYTYKMHYPDPGYQFLYYFPKSVRLLTFFFIAAGYFFRKGILRGEPLGKRLYSYCKRLMRLFFLWFFIYSFLFTPQWARIGQNYNPLENFYLNIYYLISHPFVTIMAGNITSLWFFPALIMGLVIVSMFHKLKIDKYMIPFGFCLYLLTLLGKSYSVLSFGFETNFEMRQGPFVSTLFVGIGWMLAGKSNFRLKTAVKLIIFGILMQFTEIFYLYTQHGMAPKHEYLLSQILVNTGIFWLLLACPNIGKGTVFPQWGKLTLGVFCSHQLMMKYITSWMKPYMVPIAYDVLRPTIIYFLCIVLTVLLMRNKYTKKLVT